MKKPTNNIEPELDTEIEPPFKLGELVYLPEKDPKAETLYVLDDLHGDEAFLYHPVAPPVWAHTSELAHSPF